MKFHAYLYERSPDIISTLQTLGIEHGKEIDLTADQVLALTEKFSVMIKPSVEDSPRLLCIDNPRWSFKQR